MQQWFIDKHSDNTTNPYDSRPNHQRSSIKQPCLKGKVCMRQSTWQPKTLVQPEMTFCRHNAVRSLAYGL